MSRSIRSDDPIKKVIVQNLKATTSCTKVTLVKEIRPLLFQAHCIIAPTKATKGKSLGFWLVDLTDGDNPVCRYQKRYIQ